MTSPYPPFQIQETEHYFAFVFPGPKIELVEKNTQKGGLARIVEGFDGEQKTTLLHYGNLIIESQRKGNGAEVIFYGTLFMTAMKSYERKKCQ